MTSSKCTAGRAVHREIIAWAACAVALATSALLAGASSTMAAGSPEFIRAWGSSGAGAGQFNTPYGIATDADGNVYVSDSGNNRVQVFTYDGALARSWSGAEAGGAALSSPRGIAIDSLGGVYVVDASNNRVQKFPPDFPSSPQIRWGSTGATGGQFTQPRDVAIATDLQGNVNVYVAEAANRRVQKFAANGTFLLAWGRNVDASGDGSPNLCEADHPLACQAGTTPGGTVDPEQGRGGYFSTPWGVATDSQGNVYASDHVFNRIQKFDANGNFERAWGKDVGGSGVDICTEAASCQTAGTEPPRKGTKGGQFDTPREVAVDSSNNVYVVESVNNRVQEFDADGAFVAAWGGNVGGSGIDICTEAASCQAGTSSTDAGKFSSPFGVAADPFGEIYVADSGNDRVQKFGAPPAFAVDPAGSYDFGDQEVGADAVPTQTFTVTNTGGDRLVVATAELTGSDASQFQLASDDCTGEELVPTVGSCTVEVAFDPASAGDKQATLRFTLGRVESPTEVTDVSLLGKGTEPAGQPTPEPPKPAPQPVPIAPAPPLAGSISLAPEAIVAKGKVAVAKSGAFPVEVGCPAARNQACEGKIQAAAKASGKKGKPVVVGSARYRILPGGKAKIAIKLNGAGLRLLRKARPAGRLAVTLTATSSVAGNPAVAPARTVVVLGGKRKKGR